MTFREFHNALRIIRSIDRYEFVEAVGYDDGEWDRFVADPMCWFIRSAPTMSERLWTAIEARQPKRRVAA